MSIFYVVSPSYVVWVPRVWGDPGIGLQVSMMWIIHHLREYISKYHIAVFLMKKIIIKHYNIFLPLWNNNKVKESFKFNKIKLLIAISICKTIIIKISFSINIFDDIFNRFYLWETSVKTGTRVSVCPLSLEYIWKEKKATPNSCFSFIYWYR